MTTTTPAPAEHDPSPRRRSRLPLWSIVLATVLAAAAALGAVLILDDGDDDPGLQIEADGSLELSPLDEALDDDVLAVAFTLPEGGEGTLRPLVEGPTVVNFFASWCAPCVAEMPDFERANQAFDGEVTFVGLAVNDRPADAARIVDQTGISYFWARDVRGDVATAAGSISMPTTLFLDADGTVLDVHSGAVDYDALLDLIDEHYGIAPEAS